MKKLFVTLILACATLPALAQHGHGFRHHGHYRGGPGLGWWVAPVVIGAIGYELGRQQTVVVQQPQVVVQPQAPQVSPVVQCPQGTYPFESFGWVKNQYGQFVQTIYIECK